MDLKDTLYSIKQENDSWYIKPKGDKKWKKAPKGTVSRG